MSELPSQASYLFDRRQADQERLIRLSETLNEFTMEACLRAGLGPGGRAIDVGCGPLGALIVLAELVGSEGHVVGLDASQEALAQARVLLDQRGWMSVTLVQGHSDTVAVTDLCPPGPFDLAFMRRFLVHQADPAASLRYVARLMRPGGRIVVHEIPPGDDYPVLTPDVAAVHRVHALAHAGIKARGGRWDAAHYFAALCQDAGLRLISQRGFLPTAEPVELLETHQAVLGSMQQALIDRGLSSAREVEALLRELEDAKAAQYTSAFANVYLELIAEVP
jgi:SAM-dependent methyltransferase